VRLFFKYLLIGLAIVVVAVLLLIAFKIVRLLVDPSARA
jgi:hypothetical protein